MDAQLFLSYNQQLYVSIFNIINKYKQCPLSIYPVFNYSDFVYLTSKYHLEQFPSIFEPIKCEIKSIMSKFIWSLTCLERYITILCRYMARIEKKLETIKCCIERMRSCILCYVGELNNKITCYVENLIMTIICAVPKCQENGSGRRLHISLEIFKGELISSLLSKAKCLNLFHPNTGLLNQILCELKIIYGSICRDRREMWKIRNIIECSESIKSEMDIFKCHLNKYIDSLTYVTCCIKEIIGMECLKDLNCIICEMCNFECFAKSLIEQFKSSVLVIIRLFAENVFCNIEGVTVNFECQIPSLSTIEKQIRELTCSMRNYMFCVRNIICCTENTKQTTECRLKYMCCIKTETENMESSINSHVLNFFKCSNQSIHRNAIDLTKRLSGIGKQISNDGLIKSVLQSQVIGNHNKEEFGGIWTVLSNMAIVESKFVLSKLYECSKKVNDVLIVLNRVEYCKCVSLYKSGKNPPYYQHVLFAFSYEIVHQNLHHGKLSEKEVSDDGNHLCLCLVIKFYLYPSLVKCLCRLIDTDLDLLSTLSRKFEKYTKTDTFFIDSSKLIIHIVDVIVKTMYWIRESNRWKRCFCTKPDDVYYKYFISSMIYISFLVENMFDQQNETIGYSIKSLPILADELYSIGHPTQDKCSPTERTVASQSSSPQQTQIISIIQTLNVILTGFYKSISWTPRVTINQLNSGNKIFVGNLNFFVLHLWGLTGALNLFISSGMKDHILRELEKILCTISAGKSDSKELEFLGRFFQLLSLTLVGSTNLYGRALEHIEKITGMVFTSFLSIVCKNQKQKNNECLFKEPAERIIVASCISLIYYWYNDISVQLSNKVVLDFMVYSEQCNKKDEIGYYLTRRTISYPESMCKYSRTNRIVDSTSVINNNKLEGPGNNHYSYNDAYRINTSRAHGSLKYIIIKIVLILIIVVMTIFIRVKIETDDDYKIDNLLSEENGGLIKNYILCIH